MLTFANGGSFSVSPTLDIPVQLALRSPFNPAYPAAFPPSSALCKASARIYLLSLIGLLYFITVLLYCQALNEKNSICAVKGKAPEGRRFYRNAEGLRLKRPPCASHFPAKPSLLHGHIFCAATISIIGRRSSSAMPGVVSIISCGGCGSFTCRRAKPFKSSVSKYVVSVR